MSIRAMNWALDQRTDGPSAQSVLFVIADSANEHGITFHCNPDYIAEKTRQSRGTVFRRMAELEEVGGLERISHHKNDGRRLYEVRLNLAAKLNYKIRKDGTIEHLTDDGIPLVPDGEEGECQIETQGGGESQIDTQGESPVIHPESHSCNSQDSIDSSVKNPRINPKPLSKDERGLPSEIEEDSEFEKDWEDFRTSGFPDGIINIPKARAEMKKRPRDQRRAGIVGVPAFADYCRKRGQKNPPAAHIYWRHGMWEGLAAVASVDGALRVTSHSPQSEAGKALIALAGIAGHSLFCLPNGNISYVQPVTTQLLALAETPPESDWIECALGDQSFAAWRGLIYRIFAGRTLRASAKYRVPWRWPPTVDGKTYAGTDPPPGELSDADVEALTGT